MTNQPPDMMRFNYLTTPDDAQPFDFYLLGDMWTLTRQDLEWWKAGDVSNDNVLSFLFPNGLPSAAQNTTGVNPPMRGLRVRDLNQHPQKLPSDLPIPLAFSYCVYELCRSNRPSADSKASGQQPVSMTAQEIQELEDFPPKANRLQPSIAFPSGNPTKIVIDQVLGKKLLYLFNVVVGLEWEPDREDQIQLSWAFQHASDFLYDISDGTMIFGQVVFVTSRPLASYADIVIAASNRFQGRSWVGGIHDKAKSMPIRIGRGEWRRGNSIAWNEPEGYRVIVHEWSHYALHLRDAYLSRKSVQEKPGPATNVQVPLLEIDDFGQHHITAPHASMLGMTIMETLDGKSELSVISNPYNSTLITEQEITLKMFPSSLRLDANNNFKMRSGPERISAPFPMIFFERDPKTFKTVFIPLLSYKSLGLRSPDEFSGDNRVLAEKCWLYVISPHTAIADDRKLIAQGTLELRSRIRRFELIGGQKDDIVVAVVDGLEYSSKCYQIPHKSINAFMVGNQGWRLVFPENTMPRVVVFSESVGRSDYPEVKVYVELHGSNIKRPTSIWVCPLLEKVTVVNFKHNNNTYKTDPVDMKGLDGHVIVWYDDRPFISCFSHGGNPPTHTTGLATTFSLANFTFAKVEWPPAPLIPEELVALLLDEGDFGQAIREVFLENILQASKNKKTLSITAGSSDGTVRIYFHGDDTLLQSSRRVDTSIVTTVQNDFGDRKGPNHASYAMSYPFCISSNEKLPDGIETTLEVRYSSLMRPDMSFGYVIICQLDDNNNWMPLPTYQFSSLGASAVATYLDANNSRLYSSSEPRFNQYQLWWFPADCSDPASPSPSPSAE
ncbi:MAG: hypothetical protein OHK0022_22490 [Roseiflexaceae bacterium]